MKKAIFIIIIIALLGLQNLFSESNVYMGVVLQNLVRSDYNTFKMKDEYGVLVSEIVPKSPADRAGLKKNDIILKIDGDKIYTKSQLVKMLSLHNPGETIGLTVWRKHRKKNINLKLEEMPKSSVGAYLGVVLKNLSEQQLKNLGIKDSYGVKISKVIEDSPAEKAGLEKDDIILKIGNEKVFTRDQLSKMLKTFKPQQKTTLHIFRNGKQLDIEVVLGKKEFPDLDNFQQLSAAAPSNIYIYRLNEKTDNSIGVILKSEETTEENGKNKRTERKIEIAEVMKNSPAEKVGLHAGDLIMNIDGKNIETIDEVEKILAKKQVGDKIKITVSRDGKELVFTPEVAKQADFDLDKNVLHMFFDDNNDLNLWFNGNDDIFQNLDKFFQNFDSWNEMKDIQKIQMKDMNKLKEELKKLDVKTDFDNIFKEGI